MHSRTQLASAIHSVAAGGSVMDPKIVEPLVTAKSRSERSLLSELTARERDVLAQIAQGKSNAAIAESLVLTKRAVEKHINSIFLKLNLSYVDDVASASRRRCCSLPRTTSRASTQRRPRVRR